MIRSSADGGVRDGPAPARNRQDDAADGKIHRLARLPAPRQGPGAQVGPREGDGRAVRMKTRRLQDALQDVPRIRRGRHRVGEPDIPPRDSAPSWSRSAPSASTPGSRARTARSASNSGSAITATTRAAPNFIIHHRYSGGKFLVDGGWWEENVQFAARKMREAALGIDVNGTQVASDCRERNRPDFMVTRKGGGRAEDRVEREARIRGKKKAAPGRASGAATP